jgi:two-component system LytT family response regulator
MIRALVVDDEKPSREVICNYLRDYCGDDVEVVATASSVKNAGRVIKKHNPDLVFLDIELGDGKGFDLLPLTGSIEFKVIFVTAYSEYAVKAFRFSAVDYLLKPVKIDELKEAVNRVKQLSGTPAGTENLAEFIRNLGNPGKKDSTLVIPHVKGFEILKISEIIMCRADGYCTAFHLTNGRKVISSKNLKHYEELLSGDDFARVHHSYLVNSAHVLSYTRQGEIILSDGLKASLGDAYKDGFYRRFMKK